MQRKKTESKALLHWLVRRVEVTRGSVPMRIEVAPAFNYARDKHTLEVVDDPDYKHENHKNRKIIFASKNLTLDLRYVVDECPDRDHPTMNFGMMDLQGQGHLGPSIYGEFTLHEGQAITFVLRTPPVEDSPRVKPTPEQAELAGVPFDGKSIQDSFIGNVTQLPSASSLERIEEAAIKGGSCS